MRGKVVAGAVAAVLATAASAAGAVLVLGDPEALPGTTVAGAPVGGLDRADLRAAVERLAQERTTGTLVVRAAGTSASVDRALASVDVEATVDDALAAGRGGLVGTVLGPLVGAAGGSTGRPVALVVDVDAPALDARLDEIALEMDVAPFPGGLDVRGTRVTARPPAPGRVVDGPAAATRVSDALRRGQSDPVDLPVIEQLPPTTPADVERVVLQARRALGASYALSQDGATLSVAPQEVAPLLRTAPVGDRLELRVDAPGLTDLVARKAEEIDQMAVEAGFLVDGAPPVVDDKDDLTWVPQPARVRTTSSATGLVVDVEVATARLTQLVLAGDGQQRGGLPLKVVEPELTTEQAEAAGVSSLIGTFTTYFTAGQPRATNIRRIAEIVDGAYLPSGEVFSLNGTAGERTRARGFVADGAIVDGELTDEVGGGVSQFATTLFNAAFFAGLDIEEYQPHSFFISRYPAGRESTLYWQQIDVKFLNDTRHGIVVDTSSTPTSVTVALYGDNGGRQVTATHGPRRPRGDGGFRIEVTRTTTGGDGVGGRRVFRTSYDPAPPD